ncbi:Fibroblast growth factor receptor 2 [Paramuricea clavata]|uniref:Fibroblast growth factor receptor 2 n=1 Tax=Paramuricea clavata TaxID=317549 RepID=A0A6S7GSU7_PARCT|nr:Fibroblast growth factor receptor 2 [Paramuricea clavata]
MAKGIANARPIIKKIPNKAIYDIGEEVKLTCSAEKTLNGYEIKWYKNSSNREPIEMEKAKTVWIGDIQHETLLLKSLSAQDVGIYKCKISFLEYNAFDLANITLKVPLEPDIQILNEQNNFHPNEGKGFSLSYHVLSYPDSDITWWRSKDGKEYELITQCLATNKCVKKDHGGKENITKTSFEIEDLRFPKDNFFYKCNASNDSGNDSESFQLEVYVKPEINMEKTHGYKEGLMINCSLKRSNPPEVNYTWYLCDTTNCLRKSQSLAEKSILRIYSQTKSVMTYKCKATNAAGSASKIIEVLKSGEINSKSTCTKSKLQIELCMP